jgi:hypothetical protein
MKIDITTEEISGSLKPILNLPNDIYISATDGVNILFKPQIKCDTFFQSGSQLNFNIGSEPENGYYRIGRKVSGMFGIVQDPTNRHLFDIDTGSGIFDVPIIFNSGSYITGSLCVSGSSRISGSFSTQMPTINIESNTGSIDLSVANSFYLLINTNKTHLIFSNHTNGQQVTILINNLNGKQFITMEGTHQITNTNNICQIGYNIFQGICFDNILFGSLNVNNKLI